MKVLIAGAGRLGTRVADVLSAAHNEVTLVERDSRHAETLQGLPVGRVVTGDAGDPARLERAGVLACELLIACTGADEDNLVISLLAKRRFSVPRVAARVVDTENMWLFDERWGVDAAVPETHPLFSLIEEASGSADTVALLRLGPRGGRRHRDGDHPQITRGWKPSGRCHAAGGHRGRHRRPRRRPDGSRAGAAAPAGRRGLLVSHSASATEIDAAFQHGHPTP